VSRSGASLDEQYRALREGVGAHRLFRDVVSVRGPDAESYLQGQCSQDLAVLRDGESAEALLLSPQGKIDAYLRVTRRGVDRYLLDADGGTGPAIVARLQRFKLRVDVTIEPVAWSCVALRGPAAHDAVGEGAGLRLSVSWPGWNGIDLLGPAPDASSTPSASPMSWVGAAAVECGDEVWDAVRIEAGVPLAGREVTEGTIAAEVGLVERTVSFTKGCFTGQELVARLDARGTKVARRLAGVVIAGADPDALPPVGASVAAEDGPASGALTSVAWSPGLGSAVALTLLHRRIEPPAAVQVSWDADSGPRRVTAEARPLPLVA
jgi:tRNA-modifying protein YgfZ